MTYAMTLKPIKQHKNKAKAELEIKQAMLKGLL